MPRRFLALFFAVFFALTALFAGTVYVLDPYYHFHGPVLGMPLWLRYPRYQSPGAAKNLPYDHLLLGTSVTANFHTDQFDEALGGRTQKIIIHGAYFEELLRPLDIALETHDLDQIFWGVDSDCWRKYDADNTWEDASYLFDNNPFNDLHYLLNKEMVFYTLTEMVDDLRAGGTDDEHTGGYIWGDDKEWSKEAALAAYQRQAEKAAQQVPADSLLAPAEENLSHVLARVDANPQITFTFYLPPASILFWDKTDRNGDVPPQHQSILLHGRPRPHHKSGQLLRPCPLLPCRLPGAGPSDPAGPTHDPGGDRTADRGVPRIFAKL